jgi:hypothetical protein
LRIEVRFGRFHALRELHRCGGAMNVGLFIPDSEAIGRPGLDLMSVVWPDLKSKRYVATNLFHPFTGESKIAVRVGGPEIEPMLEVHFDKDQVEFAEIFANKCMIVLSSLNVQGLRISRADFYNRCKQLFDQECHDRSSKRVRIVRSG